VVQVKILAVDNVFLHALQHQVIYSIIVADHEPEPINTRISLERNPPAQQLLDQFPR
jgi:hypothetical protein